jgi:hypothetical protein
MMFNCVPWKKEEGACNPLLWPRLNLLAVARLRRLGTRGRNAASRVMAKLRGMRMGLGTHQNAWVRQKILMTKRCYHLLRIVESQQRKRGMVQVLG